MVTELLNSRPELETIPNKLESIDQFTFCPTKTLIIAHEQILGPKVEYLTVQSDQKNSSAFQLRWALDNSPAERVRATDNLTINEAGWLVQNGKPLRPTRFT